MGITSHPSWVRGLKWLPAYSHRAWDLVAPLVGAWIEILVRPHVRSYMRVAPLVGAWIEIKMQKNFNEGIVGRTPRGCVD